MRRIRLLCAALLLVTAIFGMPLHIAAASVPATALQAAPSEAPMQMMHMQASDKAAHGDEQGCHQHGGQAGGSARCRIACAATVAVLATPRPSGIRPAYAFRFAEAAPAAARGVTTKLDPFPPRASLAA